jgi:hypothetical protein
MFPFFDRLPGLSVKIHTLLYLNNSSITINDKHNLFRSIYRYVRRLLRLLLANEEDLAMPGRDGDNPFDTYIIFFILNINQSLMPTIQP